MELKVDLANFNLRIKKKRVEKIDMSGYGAAW